MCMLKKSDDNNNNNNNSSSSSSRISSNNNYCIVKYIHLKDIINPSTLYTTTQDYEFKSALICHDSYDSMVQMVSVNCPHGFSCVYPITLHHEVLWNTGLVMNAEGGGRVAVDHLFQPIDNSDYIAVRWNKTCDVTATDPPMLSICVQIHAQKTILS